MREDHVTTDVDGAQHWQEHNAIEPLPTTPTRDDLGPDDAAVFAADERRAEERRRRGEPMEAGELTDALVASWAECRALGGAA